MVSKVAFWLRRPSDVQQSAQKYVEEYIPTTLREEMLEKIRWHSDQGDDIYLVSASLDPYLSLWCQKQGIALICSTLEVRNGRYTGNYVNGDCSKQRKVIGIQQAIDLSSYSKIYAYGDTVEDLPMLGLADIMYYQGQPITELADLN
ncbi:HAD-IB family phosphatase [Vibrio mexicanus]|uniref:HAD-IB family phosphatase n=1 Tax=Vibrio mexicanus TaxID=1004326 RepID=UPI001EE218DD|nr:HAD-IB family phosphatase [Vibrio mexicanus]